MHLISTLLVCGSFFHCTLCPEVGLRLWMGHASGVVFLKGLIYGYKHFGDIISVKFEQFGSIWVFWQ